jgi:7,8-dihydroneopterin aldolase/epimerase/oxygenase
VQLLEKRQAKQMNHQIQIHQLEVLARVGVPDEERSSPQRLVLNITFWPSADLTKLQDDISRAVDYGEVCAETRRFVQARSDRLIETLADALAIHLLKRFAIEKITIELRKYVLPGIDYVSVTVTREGADASK